MSSGPEVQYDWSSPGFVPFLFRNGFSTELLVHYFKSVCIVDIQPMVLSL